MPNFNIFYIMKNLHTGAKNFGVENCNCVDHKEEYELIWSDYDEKFDEWTNFFGLERRCSNCGKYKGIYKTEDFS